MSADRLIALALLGCSVSVPLDGRPCPCADDEGWRCNEALNVCVRSQEGPCARGGELGAATIDDFRFDWATPEALRYSWTSSADEVLEYEVDIADSIEDMEAGRFNTVTGATNPELSRSFLLGTSADEPVRATTLRDLTTRNDPYWVRLVAIDRSSDVTCTDAIPGRTSIQVGQSLWIYKDATIGGKLRPDCLEALVEPDQVYEGEVALGFVNKCGGVDSCLGTGESQSFCYANIELCDFVTPFAFESDGFFAQAYLEVAVSVSASNAYYAELTLRLGARELYRQERLSFLADGEYHIYQVPLAALQSTRTDELLTRSAIDGQLQGVMIGSSYDHDAEVRVDGIRLRW